MAIMVDDAGVGMTVEELQGAARLLAGDGSDDINRLGDPPQVGFAVIGVLAARYGFRVSVDTRSPYGGVRPVVVLPTQLPTRVSQRAAPNPAAAPDPTPERPQSDYERPPTGLPRRRRHQPAAEPPAAATPTVPTNAAPAPARPAERTASGLGAW